MIKRIEHINMTVSNLEKSYDFYHQLFGFKKTWEGTAFAEIGQVRCCHLGIGEIYLSFFEAEEQGNYQPNYGINGINHFAFEVESLIPFREKLKELNVNIHIDENYEPGERIYFYDPNGVEIELVEY
ncbi:VOC family protein [Flavivirga jejuensis]|uniref:VOC family protein n=1 Tax=Flavivirga jejuensis TaxID=870487 RepID=A0ABT8WHS8_9FLAO|nr:VOC family protein [Flavivirga jejuensis]MDO5972704.1 VOC family protein [Flavivirga jejuensis]